MIYLRLTIDNIMCQLKRFVLSVFLVSISLIMIIFSVLAYSGQGYAYNKCDELLTQGFDKTGVLSLVSDFFGNSDAEKFIEEAYDREEIELIGDSCLYCVPGLEELRDIQGENTVGEFVLDEGNLTMLTLNYYSSSLCEMELLDGISPADLDYSKSTDDNIISYLYLGYAFSDIPVGTEYCIEEYNTTYIVAGIMEKGQRWIDISIDEGISQEDLDYTIDCTYAVFEVTNSFISSSNLWISASDGHTIEEAISAAYEVAEKNNVVMRNITLAERYQISCADNMLLISYLGKLLGIVIPAMLLMLVTMQIVAVNSELKSYGIMCSMGFSFRDISIILILKNVIMAITSLIIASPFIIWLESTWFNEELKYIMETVMVSSALPCAIIIMVVVIFITSATAIFILNRYNVVELMKKS